MTRPRFEPWLHRILTNACFAEARRRKRWYEGPRILPVESAYGSDEYLTVDSRQRLAPGGSNGERAARSVKAVATLCKRHYASEAFRGIGCTR